MKKYYSKVFSWLFIGLLITFGGGFLISSSPATMVKIFGSGIYFLICIAEIVIGIILSTRIYKMKDSTAKILYLLYTFLTGLTFASIFIIFELSSIVIVFLISAILFGIFALIGSKTKFDLSKVSVYLVMGLIGVIILEIVNIFIMNNTLDMVLCIVSLIIFLGYVCFDMQRITDLVIEGSLDENAAVYGAFRLYLDFINIFIKLLRLFGKLKDN